VLATLACLGLVLATNAIFVGDAAMICSGIFTALLFGFWLLYRMNSTQEEA
jgi:hypothetical protein